GRMLSAWQIQADYLERVEVFAQSSGLAAVPIYARVLDLWRRTLTAVSTDDLGAVDTEIDWVIKHRLLQRYIDRHDLSWSSPRIAQLDLAYHDISRSRGLFNLLEARGMAATVADDIEVFAAKSTPPQTTRARLRGEFITAATAARRDFTVDWVHLKLNDQAQRTVLCKDPFKSVDERVQRLIDSM
ncbi:MAG TPA: proteasome accessory factor PafA2 family protein, partial [Candidatus Limnocylindrales bacterium]|nr:proteasome accessory factor PafA2 family protein [Candidatus Limnocylindrales bacterium]